MAKILVTGANGYLGKHIVKQLCDLNHQVIAVDLNNSNIDKRAKFINASIFDATKDFYKLAGNPDICLHLAWKNGFVHNDPCHLNDLNLHKHFIKKLIASGLKSLAVMGTMHEIGYYEGAIDENTPTNPLNNYGKAKNELREFCFELIRNKNVNFYWLRAFYIIGDDLNNNSIFSKILKAEQECKATFPLNSGLHQYDFIDVKLLAKQVSYAINQNKIQGIINICSGKPISLKEKVETFIAQNKLKIKPQYGIYPEREYDPRAIWGDNKKIESILKNK